MHASSMAQKVHCLFGKAILVLWSIIFSILSILVIFLNANMIQLSGVFICLKECVATILIGKWCRKASAKETDGPTVVGYKQ